jgi:hypothetical protein
MPVHRADYPAQWPELAHSTKAAAGWRCTGCGAPHGALAVSRRNRLYRVVLSACHLDHDPANPAPRLAALCQACHLRYDAYQRWRSRRRGLRERALSAGQLDWVEWVALVSAHGLGVLVYDWREATSHHTSL